MKARIMAIVAIVSGLLICDVNAQSLRYGMKAGYNLSGLSHTPNTRWTPFGGFVTGVYADFAPTKHVHFSPELLYSAQGVRSDNFDPASGAALGTNTLSLKYIALPLVFKVYMLHGLHVDVGAQVARLISSSYTGFATTTHYRNMNAIDYSVVMGIGYDISRQYHVGLRYGYGVNSIYKISPEAQAPEPVYANRVGNFSLSYTF